MATTASHQATSRAQGNGLLQVTAAQTSGNVAKPSPSKVSGPRLKVVIRRLAPGLTEAEFGKLLGDEWKTGQGKVDWFSYKSGKDSKDLSKPSRPSRAYLHLTSDSHLLSFSDAVRKTQFEDAQNTWCSPSLLGPPTVEFAPFPKTPIGRRRTDARQGTIDQDPEFMDFLESLANPISTREAALDNDTEGIPPKGEKVTITPLVQYLKDKKANKGKEAAASKAAKAAKQEAQASKTIIKPLKDSNNSPDDVKKTPKEIKKERLVEKAAREAVKVLNREGAMKTTTAPASEPAKPPRTQARERGSIAAAARILQRDLGLSPGNAHRKAKADADTAAKNAAEGSTSAPAPPKAPGSKSRAGRDATDNHNAPTAPKDAANPAPITLLKKPVEAATAPPVAPAAAPTAPAHMPSKSAQVPARKQPVAIPSAGATRAFIKHANPSQGVTEPLLKEAMEAFGAVSHVEIDKRKGFAYVDFVEPEGLAKAMAANPTKIAQGTVQVLERKDARPAREPPAGPARGGFAGRGRGTVGRRGGRGGRGGGDSGGGPSGLAVSKPPASAPTGPSAAVK